MAGITAISHDGRVGVVGVGRQKTDCGMTVTAFSVGSYMAFMLTRGYGAVVATGAYPGYIRMVKAAVQFQFQEMAGIVAVIAFGVRRCMKYRFTDGQVTIVTFTAVSKYFLMINRGDKGKTRRRVTGMAVITGSDVTR